MLSTAPFFEGGVRDVRVGKEKEFRGYAVHGPSYYFLLLRSH